MTYKHVVMISNGAAYVAAYPSTFESTYITPTDTYPTTRGGVTFGTSGPPSGRGVAIVATPFLSQQINSTSAGSIRIDLPLGAGQYRVKMALGTGGVATTPSLEIINNATSTSIHTVAGATRTSTQVVGADNVAVAGAGWPDNSAYVTLDLPASIRLRKFNANPLYVACFSFELVDAPLVDTILSKEDSTGSHTGAIWAKEPAGKIIGKLSAVNGAESYSIVGASTYFTLATIGSSTYVVTTATRIPDAWTGSLVIRQTSGALTRDTTFNFTAASITRPVTGILGQVSSYTMDERAKIKAFLAAEKWAGYTGQAFASDVVATSASDLNSKIGAITPDGTSWYRIRLQDGIYSGTVTGTTNTLKNFGSGGLLIEPDAGHNPILSFIYSNFYVRKCHWRNLTIIPPKIAGGVPYGFIDSGIPASAFYPLVRIDGCNIGWNFSPDVDQGGIRSWSGVARVFFVEQLIVENNNVNGVGNLINFSGGRLLSFDGNDVKNMVRDLLAISSGHYLWTPRGVFASDDIYISAQGNTLRANPDIYTGLDGSITPHGDFFQIRRGAENAYIYQPYPNGNTSGRWAVNNTCFANGNIYKVKSVAAGGGEVAGVGGATAPSGTGDFTTGGVTFTFNRVNDLNVPLWILAENNVTLAQGASINADGNATPNLQVLVDSDSGVTTQIDAVFINNIFASGSFRGVGGSGSGIYHCEFNTFVAAADSALTTDKQAISGGVVRARRNIVGEIAGVPRIDASISKYEEGNVGISWGTSTPVGRRPEDHLVGPFVTRASGDFGYNVDGSATPAKATFVSQMSKTLHSLNGSVGGRFREEHVVSVAGDGSRNLVIEP